MVTGDNINTTKAIARECGILTDDGIAIEGPDFREKSMAELNDLIPKLRVMARLSPLDKHTLVKHLRTMFNEVVVVIGDGTISKWPYCWLACCWCFSFTTLTMF